MHNSPGHGSRSLPAMPVHHEASLIPACARHSQQTSSSNFSAHSAEKNVATGQALPLRERNFLGSISSLFFPFNCGKIH